MFICLCYYVLKETVSRDGRGYESGINCKVSLNPGTSKTTKIISLKGQSASYIERFEHCTKTSHLKQHGSLQIAVFFLSAQFGIRSFATVLAVFFAKHRGSKFW